MARNRDHPDGGWDMVNGGVAVVAGLAVGAALINDAASTVLQAGPAPALGLLAAGGAGLALAGGKLAGGIGGIRWPGAAPKPLGGEVRWASAWELLRSGWASGDGWPLGVASACGGLLPLTIRMPDRAQRRNTLVLAPNGSGKSTGIMVPALRSEATVRDAARRHSLIVGDASGEVQEMAGDVLATSHRQLTINTDQLAASNVGFDALSWIPDYRDPRFRAEAYRAAKVFLAATEADESEDARAHARDPYWPQQVSGALLAILLYLKARNPGTTLVDVCDYLIDVDPENIVRQLVGHPLTAAAALGGSAMQELIINDKARSAVFSDLKHRLALLTDPRVRALFGGGALPPFDLGRFLDEPSVLYLQVGSPGDPTSPVISIVMATIQMQLIRRAARTRRLPRDVRFLIDEVGSIGRIYGLDAGVATLRKYGVGFMLICQTLDQLRTNYGEKRASTIVQNMVHRLALGGVADQDAAWVCQNLGHRNNYRAVPGESGDTASTHYTREDWPLLRPDQLRRHTYKVVLDSALLPPVLLRLRSYAPKGARP